MSNTSSLFASSSEEVQNAADEGFAVGVVALVDIVLILSWIAGEMSALKAVGYHSLTTFGVILTLITYRPVGLIRLFGTGALLLLLGPLGGPATLTSRVLSRVLGPMRPGSDKGVYAKRAPLPLSERIFDDIVQGRRHDPTKREMSSFQEALTGADSDAQYAAIAAISRKYSPQMRPALDTALRSPNAALRVQAAAVFAKLRTSYSERATEVLLALQEHPRGLEAAELAVEAFGVGSSGFVEDELKRHLLSAAKLLEGRAALLSSTAGMHDPSRPLDTTLLPAKSEIKRYSCGGMA